MIDARIAYGLGLLVGGATALGWTWVARHPARMLARHRRRMVRAYNATHGRGRVS